MGASPFVAVTYRQWGMRGFGEYRIKPGRFVFRFSIFVPAIILSPLCNTTGLHNSTRLCNSALAIPFTKNHRNIDLRLRPHRHPLYNQYVHL